MDTRVKPAYDAVGGAGGRISHRALLPASIIAARKFLHVSGRFHLTSLEN
jgi:hypothetical protein